MKKFDGILLLSDLDGTLFDENCKVSQKNLSKIEYFMNEGGRFALSTGRTARSIKKNAPYLKTNAPSVFHSGAVIFDLSSQREIAHFYLADCIKEVVSEALLKIPFSAVEVLVGDKTYVLNPNDATKWHISVEDFAPNFVCGIKTIPYPWTRVSFWNNEDRLDEATEFIKKITKDMPFESFRVHSRSFEVISSESNKGSALLYLKNNLKNIKYAIAAGDGDNDVKMLAAADKSFAPKNATEYAKKNADITLDITSDESFISAVIDIIERECANWK